MAILKNAGHERFAQLVSEGKTGTDAYLEAGHKVASRRVAGVNASRLMQRPEVKARIEEMLSRRQAIEEKATEKAITTAVDRLAISKERVLEELASIAYATAEDIKAKWGEPGPKHLQVKVAALGGIARHLGMYGAKGTEDDPLHTKNSGDASPRDVARAVLDILRQASVNGEAKEEDGDAA